VPAGKLQDSGGNSPRNEVPALPGDRLARRHRLQAPVVSAHAQGAVPVDGDVPDLAAGTARAVVDLAVLDDRAADAVPQVDLHDVLAAAPGPQEVLRPGDDHRDVFDVHRIGQPLHDLLHQRDVFPFDVGREQHAAGVDVNQARHGDAHAQHAASVHLRPGQQSLDHRAEAVDEFFNVQGASGGLAVPRDNPAAQVAHQDAQLAQAHVDADRIAGVRGNLQELRRLSAARRALADAADQAALDEGVDDLHDGGDAQPDLLSDGRLVDRALVEDAIQHAPAVGVGQYVLVNA